MPETTESELERTLGLKEALMIGVGTMVGAGIFVLPGPAAEAAGPAAALAFVLAGAVALLTAFSTSELATAMPQAGGPYHFINSGLGPLFGSIAGLGNWLGLAFATAFYAVGFGSYVVLLLEPAVSVPSVALGPLVLDDSQVGGLAVVVAFVGINYLSTSSTGSLQNVIVLTLLGILAAFVAFGAFQTDISTLRPFAPEGVETILPTTALVFVSYLGFAQISTVAGEIKKPSRNLPIAIVGSVLLVTVIYAVAMVVLLGVVERDVVAGDETAIAEGAAVVFGAVGAGVVGVGLMTFGGLLATASSANASVLSASRISYAMGRDGLVVEWLGAVHRRFKTPHRSIVLTGTLIVVFVVLGTVENLARAGSVMHLVVYGLLNVALIVFREADVFYNPDYRVPLYPYVPAAGAVLSFALIAYMERIEILLAVGLVVGSVAWYLVYVRSRVHDTSALAVLRNPQAVESEVELDDDEK